MNQKIICHTFLLNIYQYLKYQYINTLIINQKSNIYSYSPVDILLLTGKLFQILLKHDKYAFISGSLVLN